MIAEYFENLNNSIGSFIKLFTNSNEIEIFCNLFKYKNICDVIIDQINLMYKKNDA